ncbi:MAG TPA: multicopper oxidase domain-containing protein [Povalibacter sp.]
MAELKATCSGIRWLAAAVALGLMLPQAALAQGGMLDCLPVGQPLPKIPEIAAQKTSGVAGAGGVLRGTILLANEKQRLVFRQPTGRGNTSGKPGLYFTCMEQTVRVFRGVNAQPPMPLVPQNRIGDPIPGPTLRARLGDIVQLTFVNNINPGQFSMSSGQPLDQGEKKSGSGCDSSTAGYPASANDVFPDCFHGSSTGNIHFHGTHTNPNGTGDNVFLEIRPSPIVNGKPTVTDKTATKQFNEFFKACYDRLKGNTALEWPTTWNDAPLGPWDSPPGSGKPNPKTWTGQQALLVQAHDKDNPDLKPLWPTELDQLQKGFWPQFYIGAYPYCFQIPQKDAVQPVSSGPMKMGQSPGTHWYHAHKHGSTAINVANGMTGVFIIEGATYDDKLNEWYGDGWTQRQPILVMNQLGVTPNLLRSGPGRTDTGPDFSVNGRIQPVLEMKPGEVQLWRIANTAGRSGAIFLGPPPGFSWKRIAQDGVQFADKNYQDSTGQPFYMAPGNRVDLLIKAPLLPAIYPVVVQHAVGPSDPNTAYPVPLVSVRIKAGQRPVTGKQSEFIPQAPKPPAFLDDIADSEVQGSRTIEFASNPAFFPSSHTINGKKFDNYQNPQEVFLNTVEEWTITNATASISHPFHIHINPFQLVEIFNPNDDVVPNPNKAQGQPPTLPKYVFTDQGLAPGQCYLNPNDKTTWRPCTPSAMPTPRVWWDVFPIPAGIQAPNNGPLIPGYFKMRSRFVDYPGYYVLHCHILAHEDRGMMATVSVTPSKGSAPAPVPFYHH